MPDPVPIEKVCLCGRTLRANRLARGSSVECDDCGRTWFLLPIDPYPPWPKKKKRRRRAQGRKVSRVVSAAGERAGKIAVKAAAGTGRRLNEASRRSASWVARRSRSSRFRLAAVAAATVVLAAGTGSWVAGRSSARAAAVRLAAATTEARAAASRGDFLRVTELLADAAGSRAADDPATSAAAARQRVREANAALSLVVRPLHQIASEAAATFDPRFPDTWSDRFDALYRGRWVVLDVSARRAEVATGGGGGATTTVTEIDFPLALPGAKVSVEIGDTDFGLPGPWDAPRRVVFATTLKSCRPADSDGEVWVIGLEPDDVLLWADPVSLAALAFGGDVAAATDGFGSLLAEQRTLLGLNDEDFSVDGGTADDPSGRTAAEDRPAVDDVDSAEGTS
ncbi:MAG: hypothetical protein AAF532_05185 [Planctomycetota bacterium]